MSHIADIKLLVSRLELEEQVHLKNPTKASAKRVRALSLELKKISSLQRSSTSQFERRKLNLRRQLRLPLLRNFWLLN